MAVSQDLTLASLPPIFVLPTNLTPDEMHEAEDTVCDNEGQLSYEPKEARIFLARLAQKKRAAFELRKRGIWTDECPLPIQKTSKKRKRGSDATRSSHSSDTESEDDSNQTIKSDPESLDTLLSSLDQNIMVLKLTWLQNSVEAGVLLPYQPYLIYLGRITEKPAEPESTGETQENAITYIKVSGTDPQSQSPTVTKSTSSVIATTATIGSTNPNQTTLPIMKYNPRRFRDQKHSLKTLPHPGLHRQTTSEHDFLTNAKSHVSSSLPYPPAWQLEAHPRPNYACLRSTFADPINSDFLAHLFKIKDSRVLTLDEIGVRAYSTAIASLSAYPHLISSPAEITRLPGCSDRIAALWLEWWNSSPEDPRARVLSVTDALDNDEDLKALKLFYGIWGVGADTARKFYFEHGWKDLDDVVEFGWDNGSLNRVQQIGVKFYDDFEKKIPREEVESIADVVLRHARLCREIPKEWWSNAENGYKGNWNKPDDGHGDKTWDPRDMVCVIVGGYRRGKKESGDVDVILSHRDEEVTRDLVVDVVASLETEEYITHTLTLHTTTTDRDQQTLPYRDKGHAGHGFDSLDKALCVWQDPVFDRHKHQKNPNVRRRVDIIVSPWRTIGAAVLGWSGATTFERDIRRWCRAEKGWKFDSSGVRDRGSGVVLDFEAPRAGTVKGKEKAGSLEGDSGDGWEDRERRLMEGLGIGWRPATERCTG